MSLHFWQDLKATDFTAIDSSKAIALLPVGATEQHGPHLPLATDSILAQHVAYEAARRCTLAQTYIMPPITYAKSDEHINFAGTLTLDAGTLLNTLQQIGHGIRHAGFRKFVLLNAHGGNLPVLHTVARDLRRTDQLFVVTAGWMAMGFPTGLIPATELRDDVHGGLIETAAMLYLRPDLVDMSCADNFRPASAALAETNDILRIMGPVSAGWIASDLHPQGVAGNALAANAQIGKALIDHAVARYAQLLDEVAGCNWPPDADEGAI